ncbi:hypothetical protein DKT77_13020 [Meridianimarinicoccus roseus]|uniref:Secreted protein n=1 Tax=Meridianimarinicoccus roseus TaxID=2072018 RepID=A0A2V2LA95_9RHOB|nr:hypothetical protein [Meridianimarinicoccus roseus]PWR02185.1 hypothetical protein DKT77_13020 [Meridianimarinicoccus roseus]
MPDAALVARSLWLLCLGLAASPAASQDCTPRISLSGPTGTGFALALTAPCNPYGRVGVALGPVIAFGEETDADGRLELSLPPLPQGTSLTLAIGAHRLTPDLPGEPTGTASLSAVIWPDGTAWGMPGVTFAESGTGAVQYRLGFPGLGPIADIRVGAVPDRLDIPVTPDSCGRAVTASVVTGGQAETLSFTVPACDGVPGILRIPLDG